MAQMTLWTLKLQFVLMRVSTCKHVFSGFCQVVRMNLTAMEFCLFLVINMYICWMNLILSTCVALLFMCLQIRCGTFIFSFQISPIYPHEAPKVKCKTKVYESPFFLVRIEFCPWSLISWNYFSYNFLIIAGLSSQYWLGWKCLPEHSSRGLEACAKHKYNHLWVIPSFHGIHVILCWTFMVWLGCICGVCNWW